MCLVSVVIPVYNIAPHLPQCLDSVLGQSLSDLEVICVDDGSTDESPAILARYAAADSRIIVVTRENGGPGAARNTGLEQARGRYLIFLDSDDWFEPDFLARMVGRAEETGADVTICRAVEFDTHTGKELPSEWMLKTAFLPTEMVFSPGDVAEHLFQFTYGWPWDKLYRTDFVQENRLTYPSLPNSEDLVFVFQSLAVAGKVSVLDQVLVHHRVNRKTSVSNSLGRNPDVPAKALFTLRDCLKQRGLYEQYQRSFLNWAMEFLLWNVANIPGTQVQRIYFIQLKREWLPRSGIGDYPKSYYYSRFAYAKYALARRAPWGVFYAVTRCYKLAKRRIRAR